MTGAAIQPIVAFLGPAKLKPALRTIMFARQNNWFSRGVEPMGRNVSGRSFARGQVSGADYRSGWL